MDFGTEVGRFDGSEVLLIRFRWRNQHRKNKEDDKHTISRILVEHEGSSFLNLRFQNGVPELLSRNGLAGHALPFRTFRRECCEC